MHHEIIHTADTYPAMETEVKEKFEAIPLSEDYVTDPIRGFDWEEIMFNVKQEFNANPENEIKLSLRDDLYLVVFQSQRRLQTGSGGDYVSDEELAELDEGVLEEARKSSGFLYYFSGERNPEGKNMSFCLWTDPEAVQNASLGPAHARAKQAARSAYTEIDFSAYQIGQGSDGKIVHTLVFRKQYSPAGQVRIPPSSAHQL